jgi:hypothetical protein
MQHVFYPRKKPLFLKKATGRPGAKTSANLAPGM